MTQYDDFEDSDGVTSEGEDPYPYVLFQRSRFYNQVNTWGTHTLKQKTFFGYIKWNICSEIHTLF